MVFSHPEQYFLPSTRWLRKNTGIFAHPRQGFDLSASARVFFSIQSGIFHQPGIFSRPKRYFSASAPAWPRVPCWALLPGYFFTSRSVFFGICACLVHISRLPPRAVFGGWLAAAPGVACYSHSRIFRYPRRGRPAGGRVQGQGGGGGRAALHEGAGPRAGRRAYWGRGSRGRCSPPAGMTALHRYPVPLKGLAHRLHQNGNPLHLGRNV